MIPSLINFVQKEQITQKNVIYLYKVNSKWKKWKNNVSILEVDHQMKARFDPTWVIHLSHSFYVEVLIQWFPLLNPLLVQK